MSNVKTCPICGKENSPDSEFCSACGTPLSVYTDDDIARNGGDPAKDAVFAAGAGGAGAGGTAGAGSNSPGGSDEDFDRYPETPDIASVGAAGAGGKGMAPKRPKKKSKKPLIIAIVCVIAVLAIGGGVFAFLMNANDDDKTKLDLVSNISKDNIKIDGYDGEATANVDANELRQYIEYEGNDEAVQSFIQSVTYSVTPAENLKEGDKITLKADYDRTDAKEAKVKVTKDNITFTVGALEEAPEPEPEEEETPEPEPEPEEEPDPSDEDFVEYYTFRVDTTYAPEEGGKDDGFAAVRTEPSTTSGSRVGKIYQGETVDVEKNYYSNGWYRIARGKYKGYYVYKSSLVR